MCSDNPWSGSVNKFPDLYDLAYLDRDAEAEVRMYSRISESNTILEIGVGTGRIAIPLAKSGRHVWGIDIAEPMLARCREKWKECVSPSGTLQLIHGDMRKLPALGNFRYVIVPFTTFNYLENTSEYKLCLSSLRSVMTSDAIMCIELITQLAVPGIDSTDSEYELAWTRDLNSNSSIQYWCRATFDRNTQILSQWRKYLQVDKDSGAQLAETNVLWRNRLIRHEEFVAILKEERLDLLEVYGDYNFGPKTSASTTLMYVIRKAI
jgi:ubiquinone/menaquinone biosynthesis C-methylase UbiE